ncbi:hypothetical protein [Photobacterium sp. DNB22_13_2]
MHRAIFLIVFFISGCTTALWAPDFKEETVNGFYINQQNGDLVVTTINSAYIFPSESKLGEALLLTREETFYPVFEDFSLSKENVVSGQVSLVFTGVDPSSEFTHKMMNLGFTNDDVINRLKLTEQIQGKRYTIDGALPLEMLEKNYVIWVAQPAEPLETAGKVVVTPVTIAYDAVVTVPAVFLMVTVMALDRP